MHTLPRRVCIFVYPKPSTPQPEEVYLNLVLEFVPETIYRIIKHYSRTRRQVRTHKPLTLDHKP